MTREDEQRVRRALRSQTRGTRRIAGAALAAAAVLAAICNLGGADAPEGWARAEGRVEMSRHSDDSVVCTLTRVCLATATVQFVADGQEVRARIPMTYVGTDRLERRDRGPIPRGYRPTVHYDPTDPTRAGMDGQRPPLVFAAGFLSVGAAFLGFEEMLRALRRSRTTRTALRHGRRSKTRAVLHVQERPDRNPRTWLELRPGTPAAAWVPVDDCPVDADLDDLLVIGGSSPGAMATFVTSDGEVIFASGVVRQEWPGGTRPADSVVGKGTIEAPTVPW